MTTPTGMRWPKSPEYPKAVAKTGELIGKEASFKPFIRDEITNVDTCASNPASIDSNLLKGCYQKVDDYVEDNGKKVMIVSVIVVVVMVRRLYSK